MKAKDSPRTPGLCQYYWHCNKAIIQVGDKIIVDADEPQIGTKFQDYGIENEADAEFIVKSWNSLDALVRALKNIGKTTKIYPMAYENTQEKEQFYFNQLVGVVEQAQSALALAGEEV